MKRYILTILVLCLLFQPFTAYSKKKKSNLPIARQATLVEMTSPSEVMIRAAGIGEGRRKYRLPNAVEDAKKSAIYFLLYQATDPILRTPEEKRKFEQIAEAFFDINNIKKYIVWEQEGLSSRIALSKKKIKIEKTFRINKEMLINDLESRGIIQKREEIVELMNLPSIMVIPSAEKDQNPVELLKSDPLISTIAGAIESYLTSKQYDVIVPEAMERVNTLTSALSAMKGQQDMAYQMALAFGSDIFITFSGSVSSRYIGSSEVKKVGVVVKAYESTTGKLLGTETGYSEERPAALNALVEEATNNAIDNVLNRVIEYWKKEIKRGTQYKIIFKFSEQLKGDALENIQDEIESVISEISKRYKLDTMTDKTADYIVWVDPQDFSSSRMLYKKIKDALVESNVKRIMLNKKFMLLEVGPGM